MSQRTPDPPANLTPDELEQRQRPDGSVEVEGALAEVADQADRPLTADEIEQRLVVEDDEDEHREV